MAGFSLPFLLLNTNVIKQTVKKSRHMTCAMPLCAVTARSKLHIVTVPGLLDFI